MVQKKHKKRKHNRSTAGTSVASAQTKDSSAAKQPATAAVSNKKEPSRTAKKPSAKEQKKVEKAKIVEDKKRAKTAKKEKRAAAKAKKKAANPGIFARFAQYVREVKSEMQRVVWPTRHELINASLIVIGALIFFGVFIAIIDNIIVIPLDWISSLGE